MDLRSGEFFWPRGDGRLGVCAPLASDASCDVAIVGGGITGALAAHRLAHAGHSCIVLDRREIGWGSTVASTALLQYEIDVPLVKLAEQIGQADASRAYRLCHSALGELERIVAGLGGRCGLERRPSLFLAREESDEDLLERECRVRSAIGIRVEFLGREALRQRFGIDRACALVSADAAQVDPYCLTHALLTEAAGRGVRVHSRTEVTSCEPHPRGLVLATAAGLNVTARHIVYATGYEAQAMLRRKIVDLLSTFALVTRPIPGGRLWPERCLIWEAGTPYFYLRSTADGRAMMGGEDEPFRDPEARDALIGGKGRTLLAKFRAMFPEVPAEPDGCWAGTFGQTKDGLAYCGQSPEHPGALFALGFGGNGITFGVILAKIVEDLVAGRPNDDARLFRFGR